jgi:putative hydrolase of the HAD superfamily
MMAFKLVVWDFDGVLNANIKDGRFIWADRVRAELGVDVDAFQEFVFVSGLIRDVVSGQKAIHDVVDAWLKLQGYDIKAEAFVERWFDLDAIPDRQVTGWLTAYQGRSVIGTNNEAVRAAYIADVMGYGALVERVFASGPMGVAKPDAGFFAQIEAWAGVSGAEVLLIDDVLPNVEAAIARGWQGFHFTPKTRDDLPALLGVTA